MRTTAFVLVAIPLLAAGSLRIRSYLQTRRSGTGYLAIATSCAGLAILLNAPGPYVWFDRIIFRYANCSVLVSHVLTAVGAAAAGEMVVALVAPDRSGRQRLRLVGQVLIIAAMIISFTVAAASREDALFFEHYKNDAHLAVYWCIFIGSVTAQLSYVAALTLRYTRHDDKWLGRGLRLIGYGSLCVALFLASRIVEVAIPGMPAIADPAAVAMLIVGSFLLATGVLLPQAGLLAGRALSRRKLYPLWKTVTSQYPYVRANPKRPNLYRSVIEVQDALAEARSQHKINTPVLVALDALTPRPSAEFDVVVADLLSVTDMLRSLTVPTTRVSASR
jgi:hypothetical protein